MVINITGEGVSQEELAAYQDRGMEKYGDALKGMDVKVEGDEVELTYHVENPPFERIRRITGYLVGTLDRWNNAKRAEEKDRVKHDM